MKPTLVALTCLVGACALMFFPASAICAAEEAPSCCAKAASPAAALSDKSLYQAESKWTTDSGKQIKLADLKGRPQVIILFFTSCQSACPVLVHDLRRIEASLNPAQRTYIGLTLITMDPRRDTPKVLADYRSINSLPDQTWTLLRGEADDIQELAALLGAKYKQQSNGQFTHSNLITVLNAEGEIVHQLAGLGQDIRPTMRVINQLTSDRIATSNVVKE